LTELIDFAETEPVYGSLSPIVNLKGPPETRPHGSDRGDTLYTTGAVHTVHLGDNLDVLRRHVPDGAAALIYIDPPFNTGKAQSRTRIRTVRSLSGDRVGFKGHRYDTVKMGSRAYPDRFDDYLAFLEPRLREAYRALAPDGTLYFHIDYREVHYCKVLLDRIFGRESFLNEIIWAYDYGGRPTRRWPPKHDNILVYVKDPARYVFDELGYRRFEWKCNDRNEPSKRAARRFGFAFEGVFRQHMWTKGKNRDTAWFAMLDRDWPRLREAYERWLDPANFDPAGRQRARLSIPA